MQPNSELSATISKTLHVQCMSPLNMTIPSDAELQELETNGQPLGRAVDFLNEECKCLSKKLQEAVRRRVGYHSYYCAICSSADSCQLAHIAIMFSGGIDSMMLAYLADKCVPQDQPIDLLNVAFQVGDNSTYEVPDRLTGRQALDELPTSRVWNFVEVSCDVMLKFSRL